MDTIYFHTPADWRAWLEENYATAQALTLGLRKKGAAIEGITYDEALDEALCFGWIDGGAHSVDGERWTVRFTPRRPGSKWSLTNVRHVERLKAQGRMTPAGLAAFENHAERLNTLYETTFELEEMLQARFAQADPEGWAFYQAQPPSYRRIASRWIMDGKREETRLKRLAELMTLSAQRKRKEFM